MELKMLRAVEDKSSSLSSSPSSPRSDQFKRSRSRNHKAMISNILEAIAQVNDSGRVVYQTGEDGALKMKIVLKKDDLKQVLDIIKHNNNNGASSNNNDVVSRHHHRPPPPPASQQSLEQRLNSMRKRHILIRASSQSKLRNSSRRSSWSPVLHTIPEEL